ncbi:MAG: hypothetical protein E7I89_03575 [Haemophilus parainfluenzae]|jgi:hypothetical protein|nr:hypothetical protein [Haemophilus parainfluenzae]MDU4452488.1 hypothetical protein [Haemophilus parainfluenzae]MDU4497214.1 hypothetical protein [Haemophilus parainfluenzae]
MTKINSDLYFYKGIQKISDVKEIEQKIEKDGDLVNGSYKFNDLLFTFLDITDKDKDYNIFVTYLSLKFNKPKSKQIKTFQSKFKEFFKDEISATSGIKAIYNFEQDGVKVNISSSIPYKGEVNYTENIIHPVIEIMYSLYLELYLFFMQSEKDN